MGKVSNFNPKYGIKLTQNIMKLYGKPFFWLNTTIFTATVGITLNLVKIVALPYYQSAGVDGQTLTEMAAVGLIPWTCKGFFGLVADILPLFGRQKLYYVIGYILIGLSCCATLAFLPFEIVGAQPIIGALLFFGFNISSAACDLLIEAKYIELMQKNPGIRSDLLTYARFCETAGQLVPTIGVGIIADITDVRLIFVLVFPALLLPLPCLYFGGMINDTVPKHKSNKIDFQILRTQWKLVTLTGIQFCTSIGTVVATSLGSPLAQMIYILIIALGLNLLGYMMLDRRTANYYFYLHVSQSLYFNIQGALEYYYTADEDCVLNGPQFPYSVTNTLAPLCSTIAAFFGIICIQIVFTDWKFQTVFWTTTVLRILASISDIVLVKGWNRHIGIPDVIVFLGGYATINHLAYIIDSVVVAYLIAKLAPKNFEATMFALLASAYHVGGVAASYFGAFMMESFNIETKPNVELNTGCNFDNLVLLIIVGHAIVPLLSIPPIFFLLPPTKLCEPILENYDSSIKTTTKTLQEILEAKENKNIKN